MKELQSQIDQIEVSLQEERQRAIDRIVDDYSASVGRENLVRAALEQQQKQVNQIAEKSVQYNILKREVDTNKQLYEGLLQRLKDHRTMDDGTVWSAQADFLARLGALPPQVGPIDLSHLRDTLSRLVAQSYLDSREALGFPMLPPDLKRSAA